MPNQLSFLSIALSCVVLAAAVPVSAYAQTVTDGAAQQTSDTVPCSNDAKLDTDKVIASCTTKIDNTATTADGRLRALIVRASRYGEKGEAEAALTDLDRAVAENGTSALAFRARGEGLRRMNKPYQALRDLNESLRLEPSSAESLEDRGNVYISTGKFDLAIDDYNAALRLDPGYTQAFSDRGVAYYQKGDYQKAIDDYSQAIKLDADRPRTFTNRGAAYKKIGRNDLAIVDETEAIRRDPTQPEFFDNRGLSYAENGDYDRAITDYNEAIRLRPRANFYTNRGDSYNFKKDYDLAIADYDAALRLDPNFVLALNNRGAAWEAKGDDQRALADYDAALQRQADLETAITNRRKILTKLEREGATMPIAATPSFDCATAKRAVEKAICADPALSKLDRDIDVAYTRAFAIAKTGSAKAADALRQEQRDFILSRNISFGRADYDFRDAMEKRLQELQAKLPSNG
jgi:tetratricopeptide (TPR) repeat protein